MTEHLARVASLPEINLLQTSLREKFVEGAGGLSNARQDGQLTPINIAVAQVAGALAGDYTLTRELLNAGADAKMFSSTPGLLKSLANATTFLQLAGEREKAEQMGNMVKEAAEFVATNALGHHVNAKAARSHGMKVMAR